MDTTAAPYRTCGEILLGNLSKSKRQYVLKCSCNEEFFLFEDFIIHHSDLHVDDERDQHLEGNDFLDEVQQHEYCKEKVEQVFDEIDEKEESTNNRCIEELFEEIDEAETDDENLVQVPESVKKTSETNPDSEDEGNDGQFQSDEDEYDMEDNLCRSFVSDFLETEEKFLTLVEAYKNQPQLWNLKEYPYVRSSTERNTYFTNIANELRNKLNVQVPNDYIRVAIYRLRQCYRNKCANSGASGEENEGVRSAKARPKWYFSKLKFLEPFLCKNSIDKLDTNQPYLQENQIKKLLNLYERYPHLWNTNLIESVCKNKRNASLKQLAETIHSEMGLKVSEFSLKKYLNGLHFRFCKEKTNVLKADGTPLHSSVYYEHMKFLFDHVGPFYCSECSRKYRNPLHLKAHKCQSHGCERLSCPQCGKQFEQVEPYVAHARRHMNDLNEKCTVCGKMFLRKADLKLHMRSHTGDKPYFCETCGARFAMPTALQQHRKRHTKDYKCHCPICSKPFYTNDHMKRHLETKHSDVRNFECQTCGKAFKTKKTLMGHESTHEEGRKYPCPLCGKMYKNTIGVSQHLRIHRAKIETKSNPLFNQ